MFFEFFTASSIMVLLMLSWLIVPYVVEVHPFCSGGISEFESMWCLIRDDMILISIL